MQRREPLRGFERQALTHAGQSGGQWLEVIGKTDLVDLTPEEWLEFLEIVVKSYAAAALELDQFDECLPE